MTLVESDDYHQVWQLVTELSSQLSANQALCKSLQDQAEELKGQAMHAGTGFALRRFNTDISKEKFESQLEKLNSQLVLDNQTLAYENRQSQLLMREYETMLETIMGKFRSFTHATQQHTLALTEHYETRLNDLAADREYNDLHANTALSEHLAHLGGLVRSALREIDGEALDDGASDDAEMEDDGSNGGSDKAELHEYALRKKIGRTDPFEAEGYHVGSPSGGAQRPQLAIPHHVTVSSSSASSSSSGIGSSASKSKKRRQGYGSARTRDPRWYGTGGYTGVAGDPDAEIAERALEAQIEEERLRHENELLRELLRVSSDFTPEIAERLGMDPPQATPAGGGGALGAKLNLGKPRGKEVEEKLQNTATSFCTQEAESTTAHGEASGRARESGSQASPYTIASSSESTFSDINHGVILDHHTGGAGGPPQLADEANSILETNGSLEHPRSGIVVTANMDPGSHGAQLQTSKSAEAPQQKSEPKSSETDTPDEPVPLDTEAMIEIRGEALDASNKDHTAGEEIDKDTASTQTSEPSNLMPAQAATGSEKDRGLEQEARAEVLDSTEAELKRASEAATSTDSSLPDTLKESQPEDKGETSTT